MITRTSALSFRDQVRRHHIHLRTGSYSGHKPPDVVAATLTNQSDLVALIIRKWTADQKGKCALCGGPLTQTAHKMLKASADRIDSSNIAYDDANTQLTHLACNLAKNQWGFEAFEDWLAIVRDVREVDTLPERPPMQG